MAWQGKSLWFDRSVSEALTAAFAIAGKPAPKLVVGVNPNTSSTWSYEADKGKFYVPIMPSATMTDEQEHLFRAAIAHEIAGADPKLHLHGNIRADVLNRGADEFAGVREQKRHESIAREQVLSIAQGLSTAMIDKHVTDRWPGMARSLRRATESLVTSAVKRVNAARKDAKAWRKKSGAKDTLDNERFAYSELALLAGYAANGGNLHTLLRNVEYDVDVPDDFKAIAKQLAGAADAEGCASSPRDLVPTALRWLRYFEQPPEPPPSDDADGDDEGEGEGGGQGDGQGKGQGQGSGQGAGQGTSSGGGGGGGSNNPYDGATMGGDAEHSEGKSFASQAGQELMDQQADRGTGRDTATYNGEVKVLKWDTTKAKGKQVMSVRDAAGMARHRFPSSFMPSMDDIDASVAAHTAHYERDVGVLTQALRQALRGPTITRQARHQVGRFNPRNAARYLAGNRDVFDRVTYLPGDKVSVSILVDASGSMNCRTQDHMAMHSIGSLAIRAACVLSEALHRMGVAPRLAVYTTYPGAAAGVYEMADHKTTRAEFAKRRDFVLDRVWAFGGTPTLPALANELDALTRRDESQRFMFLLTDGQDGHPHDEHRATIESAKARGVTTIILATGGDAASWKNYKDALDGAAIVLPVPAEQMGPVMGRALVKELLYARMMANRR